MVFGDFFNFRYMITPPLITLIYALVVVVITIAALAAVNTSVLGAILGWILAMLWVRVVRGDDHPLPNQRWHPDDRAPALNSAQK